MSKNYYLEGRTLDVPKPSIDNIYYFDNNSTTLIYDDRVKQSIADWISCGNPSNTLHDLGQKAHDTVQICRHKIAKDLSIKPCELYFTSGATESNNLLIQGLVRANITRSNVTLITSSFEHPSVVNIFKNFEDDERIEVIYVNPYLGHGSDYGRIRAIDIEHAINIATNQILLVSIMYANNETGAVQDIKSIGDVCQKYGIFFHSDITQALGKYIIHPKLLGINAVSFSAHKFHGPKGIGGLYIENTYHDQIKFCYGGEQENHTRPGTENVANIVGLAMSLELAHIDRIAKSKKTADLRDYIFNQLLKVIDIELIGPKKHRLPNTLLIKINGIKCNKVLVKYLNKKKIYISVGSACQTDKKASHVLSTMGIIDKKEQLKIVRISLSDYTTKEEAEYLIENMQDAVKEQMKN